jgi:hypothetical protein
MDYKTFLNENEEVKNEPVAEKVIEDIVTGKLKPIEVSPKDSKDKTIFSFSEPEDKEGGDFNEEAEFYLPNDESLFVKFSWGYSVTPGMRGDGYLTPDDPDEYELESLEITEANYYYNEGNDEMKIALTPKIEDMLKDYFEKFLQVDQSKSYVKDRKAEKARIV